MLKSEERAHNKVVERLTRKEEEKKMKPIIAESREIKEKGTLEIKVKLPDIGMVAFELDKVKDFFGKRIDLEEATIIGKIRDELKQKKEARFGATWRLEEGAFDESKFELFKKGKPEPTSEPDAFYAEDVYIQPETGVKVIKGRRFREGEDEKDWYECQKIDCSALNITLELGGEWRLILQEIGCDAQIGKHSKKGRWEGRTWTLGGISKAETDVDKKLRSL